MKQRTHLVERVLMHPGLKDSAFRGISEHPPMPTSDAPHTSRRLRTRIYIYVYR
jgi:hypothetical protein